MAIVSEAREVTAGKKVEPRDFPMPGEEQAKEVVEETVVSPGEEIPASQQDDAKVEGKEDSKKSEKAAEETQAPADEDSKEA